MAERKKKSSSNKDRNDKFVWKAGDVKIYKSEAEWRKATGSKKGKK